MQRTENYMVMEFLSRSSNESFARTAVATFAAQLDPTLDEIGDIKTAVSEAVTNSIVHGYPKGTEGEIELVGEIFDDTLHINVFDYGVGIKDVNEALEPFFTTKECDERSGMGFTIMESFMDGLTVRSKPGRGTTVTLRKVLQARPQV